MKRSSLVSLSLLAAVAGFAVAGPIDPPAGPVGPTMKPLDQVEPRTAINAANTPGDADSVFKITQPGSYYLAGNVAGVAGKFGIEIAVAVKGGVTIDLRGFEMVGVAGSKAAIELTLFPGTEVTVRDGTIRNWGANGLVINGAGGGLVEGVHALSNTGHGILATSTIVRNCTARSNTLQGIQGGAHTEVIDCVATLNGGTGIYLYTGGAVRGCSASVNGGDGIYAGESVSVIGNSATNNTGDGIEVAFGCIVLNNNCSQSFNAAGIHATANRCRIEGNNVSSNSRGIDVDSINNLIIRNSASANGTAYDIVAGNTVGPTVGSGNIGSSTNPHANYSM